MKRIIFIHLIIILLLALLPSWGNCQFTVEQVGASSRVIQGVVHSRSTEVVLENVVVRVKRGEQITKTDKEGHFIIKSDRGHSVLEFSFTGFKTKEVNIDTVRFSPLVVMLEEDTHVIDEVDVVINTGYQRMPRERLTGSFSNIDKELINRSVSMNVMERIENLVPGIVFNHGDAARTDEFLIRGRSTISADAKPLIVLDDFPYDGDINNLNPNDIESITLLKDAAAASIWGARAGNGVIVITTKKGNLERTELQVTASASVSGRPDLRTANWMTSFDRIEMERFLYEKGRYNTAKNPTSLSNRATAIPEAVELMIENAPDLEDRLAELARRDVLDDFSKYFYRPLVREQYNINANGGQRSLKYYFSAGLDRNKAQLVGQSDQRVSVRSSNIFQITKDLTLDMGLVLTDKIVRSGNNDGINTSATTQFALSPYSKLAEEDGSSRAIYVPRRKGYVDTVGAGYLRDWNYRPLDEIYNESHTQNTRDYLLNLGLNYRTGKWLEFQAKYQFQSQQYIGEDLFREQSFYVRNNINDFAQINRSAGTVNYPFPQGAVLWRRLVGTTGHQGRVQANYNYSWDGRNTLVALVGSEIRQLTIATNSFQNLGYNEETGNMDNMINTTTYFRRNSSASSSRITVTDFHDEGYDHFISFYGNASYTFDGRYTVSGSFRKDEANLFGLNTNKKGTPLWSMGLLWNMANEKFFGIGPMSVLNVRATYGINGNIARNASAITTMMLSTGGYSHSLPTALLNSPPNRNLAWERVEQMNLGIDFSLKSQRLSGTIEFYRKNATNLLAQAPVDPTYGVNSMYLNVADMAGKGWDIQLESRNIDRLLKWNTNFIYSYSYGKVKKYLMPTAVTGRTYLPITLANPLVGKPLFSVYAFSWEGLDPETGSPRGRIDDEVSIDYNALYNRTTLDELQFFGTAQPVHYGSVRNTFRYRNIECSFNVSFKMGYFFRRSSVNYTAMFANNNGHSDYAARWQKPGDELLTDIPSLIYPAVSARDQFYINSAVLVEPGDHIRLEDVVLAYRLPSHRWFSNGRVFLHCANLGLIWKENDRGIDPYFNGIPTLRPSFSVGAQLNF